MDKKIFQAINSIMAELKPIAKGRKNTQQNYSFRGVDDAMNALQPLMTKHGVFPVIHDAQDIQSDEVESKQGTRGYHYVRRYTVRFYATDGSYVDAKSDGEAIDYGDKASNKAMSVAYREALFKTFVVPFGNDDIENHNHEVSRSKPKVEEHGNCDQCGAPKAKSQKGTTYCSAKCWTRPRQAMPMDEIERINQELNF